MTEIAPYGSWASPISAERVMAASVRIGEIKMSDYAVWWSELRPREGGRTQIVRRSPNGEVVDVLPDGFSAQSSVHEYGGGAWWLADETVFFVNGSDQRIWRLDPGFDPIPITPEPQNSRGLRYADGVLTPDNRWIVCVQEAHAGETDVAAGASEPVNRVVAVPSTGGSPVVLRSVADFVMSPRIDIHGEYLAWVEWDHPNMPWDASELWCGHFDTFGLEPRLIDAKKVAGGPEESVVQPEWDDDNRLWFCSDRTDWWNLYHFAGQGMPTGEPMAVAPGSYEVALPPWVFGQSRYTFLSDNRVVFAYSNDGIDHLRVLDTISGRIDHLPVECTSISQLTSWQTSLIFLGGSFTAEPTVLSTIIGRAGATSRVEPMVPAPTFDASELLPEEHRNPPDSGPLSSSWISEGQPITFPSDGGVAHGIYYPPTNPDYEPMAGERPPLIVMIHGGPTSAASPVLNLRTQFWTSRGFAVVDVNHRGSTGFGRKFRNELNGRWGVVDVADCVAAAQFLANAGRADSTRLLIRGGSAGGFTTLAALAFSDVFAAGCSLYGISDLELLLSDDHKFESQYTLNLVAPYPEGAATYRERSPIHHLDHFDRPIIMFQGLDDRVVPPNQTEVLAAALSSAGVAHCAIYFAGEGHGFRQAPNILRCLEGELSFYAQVLGFPEPEGIEPVVVENLSRPRNS